MPLRKGDCPSTTIRSATARLPIKKTRKRAIKPNALQALKDYHPVNELQNRAKQSFFFSFLTIGTSFVGIALLRLSNIIEGRIQYKRRKTGRPHSIPVTPALQQIIEVLARDKKLNDYIFNIVRSEDTARQAVQIRDELRRYNKTLKGIGEACGIENH